MDKIDTAGEGMPFAAFALVGVYTCLGKKKKEEEKTIETRLICI
jgi:hypothetical protein